MTFQPQILTLEDLQAMCRELRRRPSRYGRLRWRDLDKPGPEHDYIIDGFLSVEDKSIIGGPSGSGKSFLAIHAGMSIAMATIKPDWQFFGKDIIRPGLVIYQAGEGARGVKKRLRAFRRHFAVPADVDLPFELLMSPVDLFREDGDTKGLIDEIKAIKDDYPETPLVSVFIDTLATATGGADENSGRDMGAVMKHIDLIRMATGANVTLVHHLNAAGTKLRGHTSVFANVDQVIHVVMDDKTRIRTVSLGKQKDDDDTLTIRFELMSVETGRYRKRDGKPETSCVCLPVGEKEAMKKEEQAQGFNLTKVEERRIFGALLKALDLYGQPAAGDLISEGGAKVGTRTVALEAWRDVYAEMNPDDDGQKPSAASIGQRLRNNREPLQRFGVIGIWKGHIWWTGKPVRGFAKTQSKANSEPISDQSQPNSDQTSEPIPYDLPL